MPPPSGARLATLIAQIVGEASVHASAATADGHHATRVAHNSAFMEHLEGELAPLAREVFGEIAAMDDMPPDLKAFYQTVVQPTHQGDLIIMILAFLGLAFTAPFAAAAGKLQAIKNQSMALQQSTPLNPETAASLAARRVIDGGFAGQDALYNGMAGIRFNALVDGSKHSPDIGTILEMVRLGLTDAGGANGAFTDGGIREQWHGPLLGLNKRALDQGTAVAAAVENHIDLGGLQELFRLNGIDPAYAALALETAGRPPGVVELAALVNRGVQGTDWYAQAIRESDIKDKYIAALLELRHHYPPFRSVVAMLAAGAIDQQTAATWLAFDGVHPSAIDAVVREALNRKHTKVRELSQAQVLLLYRDREIDRGTAAQHLAALHMDQHEQDILLGHADFEREHALQVEAARRVQKRVVAHLVDGATATEELHALGMEPEQAALALRYWELERDQQVATLTPAQVSALAKRGRIDRPEFDRRLKAHGYSDVDLGHLWFLATGH